MGSIQKGFSKGFSQSKHITLIGVSKLNDISWKSR